MTVRFVLISILYFFSTIFSYYRGEPIKLTTEQIPENEIIEIYNRMDVKLINEPYSMELFSCFDVNENGDFIIGIDENAEDKILIYDESGHYLYGFVMEGSGTFGVEWDETNVIVYPVRSNLAVWIDKDGNCQDMKRIPITTNNNRYWDYVIRAKERTIAENQYISSSEPWVLFGRSKLIKIDANGNETVLYAAENGVVFREKAEIIIIILFFVFGLLFVILKSVKSYKNYVKNMKS